MMRYGICHTLVLDNNRKFVNVFAAVMDLLQLNCHVLSAQNHNGMLVEHINRDLNEGVNKHGSVRVALDAILLLLYAWNSAPIPGSDLSRSIVVFGCIFSLAIDFFPPSTLN